MSSTRAESKSVSEWPCGVASPLSSCVYQLRAGRACVRARAQAQPIGVCCNPRALPHMRKDARPRPQRARTHARTCTHALTHDAPTHARARTHVHARTCTHALTPARPPPPARPP
eukprot:3256973-Prymnesium_polylepis.1